MNLSYNEDRCLRRIFVKKKATLVIKNIKAIYTNTEVITYGYIAICHELIIGIGCDNYVSYIDKDTRILDASNHIVVPSFIEPHAIFPCFQEDVLRKETECLMEYIRNGTLSMHTTHPIHVQHHANFHYELFLKQKENKRYPILYGDEVVKGNKKLDKTPFCISSANRHYHVYNQLTYAQILYMKEGIPPQTLLKAMTFYAAKHLHLEHLGSIQIGKQADLLVLSCPDLKHFFSGFGNSDISQIIKKGVRIYPFLLI